MLQETLKDKARLFLGTDHRETWMLEENEAPKELLALTHIPNLAVTAFQPEIKSDQPGHFIPAMRTIPTMTSHPGDKKPFRDKQFKRKLLLSGSDLGPSDMAKCTKKIGLEL
jgi:hypothetical protein